MRFNPIKLLEGLLCTAPALLLTLAACGGGGGGSTTTTTIPVVAPSTAPTGVTAAGGCTAININWYAVAGATGYNVYGVSGVTATKLTATPVATTSYTNTGLAPSTSYSYQVTATNSAGEGPASTAVSVLTKTACTVMGGSLQGNALVLSKVVSTLAGAGPLLPGSADGTGTAAQFNTPGGVTTDGTNLYVADTNNHVIRKIVISSGVVSTLAGTAGTPGFTDSPAALFNRPKGITITPDKSTLYVADTQNDTIRQIIISNATVTTIAGTAGAVGFANSTTGTSATFSVPAGITTDGTNLYVADTGNNAIRQIVLSVSFPVTTVAGTTVPGYVNSSGGTPQFNAPQGITTDATNLYVADTGNNVIRQIVISGATVTTVAGSTIASFVNGAGTSATFNAPQGITMDGQNLNLYVGDTKNNAVRQIALSGPTVSTVAGSGTAGFVNGTGIAAQFNLPNGITTDGTNLYTADTANQTIRQIQ